MGDGSSASGDALVYASSPAIFEIASSLPTTSPNSNEGSMQSSTSSFVIVFHSFPKDLARQLEAAMATSIFPPESKAHSPAGTEVPRRAKKSSVQLSRSQVQRLLQCPRVDGDPFYEGTLPPPELYCESPPDSFMPSPEETSPSRACSPLQMSIQLNNLNLPYHWPSSSPAAGSASKTIDLTSSFYQSPPPAISPPLMAPAMSMSYGGYQESLVI